MDFVDEMHKILIPIIHARNIQVQILSKIEDPTFARMEFTLPN